MPPHLRGSLAQRTQPMLHGELVQPLHRAERGDLRLAGRFQQLEARLRNGLAVDEMDRRVLGEVGIGVVPVRLQRRRQPLPGVRVLRDMPVAKLSAPLKTVRHCWTSERRHMMLRVLD